MGKFSNFLFLLIRTWKDWFIFRELSAESRRFGSSVIGTKSISHILFVMQFKYTSRFFVSKENSQRIFYMQDTVLISFLSILLSLASIMTNSKCTNFFMSCNKEIVLHITFHWNTQKVFSLIGCQFSISAQVQLFQLQKAINAWPSFV